MMAFSMSFAAFEVPPRVDDLRRVVGRLRPDLIVHESAEYAGPLVAQLEGLPSVNHSFGVLVQQDVLVAAGDAAAEHWRAHGLPVPDRGGMFRGPYLDVAPPSMQYPHIETVPRVQRLRPIPMAKPGETAAGWMLELGARPVVLVTFGTVFNERGDLFRAVIEGLDGLDLDVVVAGGGGEALTSLGAVPPNVQVREWVTWTAMLERTSVVVCHGGASSTLGPLYFGIPLVIIPLGADHFVNAESARNAGVATVLDADTVTPTSVHEAVATALRQPARIAARRVADEIAEMPSPAEVARYLEGVTRG
jgi:UDP:flavonoid glycosyltransferase YjiC (YdhE family)